MKLELEVRTEGKSLGKKIAINLPQFIVGRDKSCHLRPASAIISKRHCAILKQDGKVIVRDFNSTNGTFVNDHQVDGEKELENDDLLKIGPLTFKVFLEKAAAETTVGETEATPVAESSADDLGDDDSVAAMLLSLGDDSVKSDSEMDSGEIPAGSTIMDIVPTDDTATTDAEEPKPDSELKDQEKTDENKEQKKSAEANTSLAAKAILEKYTRRTRS